MLTRHIASAVFLAMGLLAGCASAPIQLHDQPGGEGATALIILPEQIEVATVNGLEISGAGGLLRRGDTTLEVAPGRYELVAYYRELWEKGDHHDMFRSDPALFIVEAEAGHRYRLDYTRPANLPEAEALAKDFRGWVEDLETGARTPSQDSGLQFRKGLIPAATFDSTLVPSAGTGGARQSRGATGFASRCCARSLGHCSFVATAGERHACAARRLAAARHSGCWEPGSRGLARAHEDLVERGQQGRAPRVPALGQRAPLTPPPGGDAGGPR
jgi:hypothetical protein